MNVQIKIVLEMLGKIINGFKCLFLNLFIVYSIVFFLYIVRVLCIMFV